MKKHVIAIIGLGYWGTIVTNTLVSMKIFKKIFIYDTDYEKVKIIKKKFGNKVYYLNLDKIKKDRLIKNIFLATPPKINFKLLNLLIDFEKNILIEKPGLINLNQYKKIKDKIVNKKNKISFGYIYIYNNYVRYIKKIIKTKKLGQIRYVNLQRQNFGPIRNKVSAVYDLATHDISILNYLFDKKILLKRFINHDILGKNNFDISYLNLMSGDIKIDINVSWLNPEKIRKIIIIGSKKMLVFDEMNSKQPLKIYNNYVSFPKIKKFTKYYFNHSKYIFKGKSNSIKLKETKPLNNEILEFLHDKNNITDINFSENIIKVIKDINK